MRLVLHRLYFNCANTISFCSTPKDPRASVMAILYHTARRPHQRLCTTPRAQHGYSHYPRREVWHPRCGDMISILNAVGDRVPDRRARAENPRGERRWIFRRGRGAPFVLPRRAPWPRRSVGFGGEGSPRSVDMAARVPRAMD